MLLQQITGQPSVLYYAVRLLPSKMWTRLTPDHLHTHHPDSVWTLGILIKPQCIVSNLVQGSHLQNPALSAVSQTSFAASIRLYTICASQW